ncbi:hypothetical protein IKB17_04820 [bacterium]|nr:hypothetical protein [bacterium]
MGLAASQARFLMLTARKADVECRLAVESMRKQSLAREMSELSQEYYSRLQSKNISYFANGQYNKMNYKYLMGPGANYTAIITDSFPMKDKPSMVLTDYKGQVVMSNDYANAMLSVLGSTAMDSHGVGTTFSRDKIAEIISNLCSLDLTAVEAAVNNTSVSYSYTGTSHQTMTGNSTGGSVTVDNTDTMMGKIQQVVDFYYPIFSAAAANGWTIEYNNDMAENEDYISDAIVTGSFQLANVNDLGQYDEGCTLNYFITAGLVESRTDSEVREEVTAWYDAEKNRIADKENIIDLNITDISGELEAVKVELQSLKTLIQNGTEIFNWGSG